eukprot:TRINITY_DN4555_c0_g1_i2.p1 TRINITY_DN4555_c0_g1~~TRINITY_DN4555_c0_g1_i2.p1  ORF type:complete len:121 (+),score=34.39 TRINITY_DN4555_c0_g1_i2:240-602(+)
MILKNLPLISQVSIHVCPEEIGHHDGGQLLMRPEEDISSDVQHVLAQFPQIQSVSHVVCHYVNEKLLVEVTVRVEEGMTVKQVSRLAEEAKQKMKIDVSDISQVDVHLELLKEIDHPSIE